MFIVFIDEEIDKTKRAHAPLTEDEVALIWKYHFDHPDDPYTSLVLIQCYSGWRPAELCNLRVENVSINELVFNGGSKTKAGRNRTVPIHSGIRPLVEAHFEQAISLGSPMVFNVPDSQGIYREITYDMYKAKFEKLMKTLEMKHSPHDCRRFFITEAKRAGIDDNVIKLLVGHSIRDVTESAYTSRDIEWLRKDIEKIKCTNNRQV